MNLLRDRFLFLDCQTTAANPVLGSILEIAWCDSSASESQPSNIQCKLVSQPNKKEIPFRIQVITGISDEEMVNAVHEREIYFSLKKHCTENKINAAVVHYASFEKPFLQELFEKHGDEPFPLDLICTYQIARRLFPNLPTRGIRGLGGFFGASNCELKRSSHHVEMTFSIWQGLVGELAKHGIDSVEELREWLKAPVKAKRTKYQYPLESEKRLSLPDKPGVYKMMNAKGEILYVGKATSLKSRVNSYFRGQRNKDPRKLEMLTQTHNIAHVECGSALEAAILETDEIKKYDPPYNYSLKRKQRQLAFFNRDLNAISNTQSAAYPIGPFPGHFALEQFTRVHAWLTKGEDDPLIFFDEVPVDLICSGFELFCAEHGLDPTLLVTPRDLMAFCIRFIRKSARLAQQKAEEGTDVQDTGEPEYEDLEDNESEDLLVEYTPEEVSGKFGRLFRRIAKSYLRGKVLTRLLDSRIIFEEKSKIRRLEVRGGEIVHSELTLESRSTAGESLWENLDVMTYDRMSVLLSEIIKMRSSGQNVIIEPDMTLSIVSHQIV